MIEVATKYGAPGLPIVNLIPPDIDEKRKLRQVQSLCLLIIAGVIGLVAFLFIGATTAKNLAKDDLEDAAGKQKLALAERNALSSVLADYRSYENRQFAIAQAGWGDVNYSQLLRGLLDTTGPNAFISTIAIRTPAADIYPSDSVEMLSPLGVGSVVMEVSGNTPTDVIEVRERLAGRPGLQWVPPRGSEWASSSSDNQVVWRSELSIVLTQEILSQRFFPAGALDFDPVQMARTGLARFEELVAEQEARNAEADTDVEGEEGAQ